MNWRSVRAIALKDLKEVRRNRAAWIPALILPVIFAVAMPAIFIAVPQLIPTEDTARELADIQDMIARMPASVGALFAGWSLEQGFVVYMAGYLLAPLFLIMPLMFSAIIGSE